MRVFLHPFHLISISFVLSAFHLLLLSAGSVRFPVSLLYPGLCTAHRRRVRRLTLRSPSPPVTRATTQNRLRGGGYLEFFLSDGAVLRCAFKDEREVAGWETIIERFLVRRLKIRATSPSPSPVKGRSPSRSPDSPIKLDTSIVIEDEAKPETVTIESAIAKDGFDFFIMVNSLVRDREKYYYIWKQDLVEDAGLFKRLCMIEEFPLSQDAPILQCPPTQGTPPSLSSAALFYRKMSERALPKLLVIAKRICLRLGIESIGLGPVKTEKRAVEKASRKYKGDIRAVKDWCRVMIVCDDFMQLVAAIELVRAKLSQVLVRLKLRSLTDPEGQLAGGYRHCLVNLLLEDHICELVITTKSMFSVCENRGVRHYFHCMDLEIDSLSDVRLLMKGAPSEQRSQMIAEAEKRFPKLRTDVKVEYMSEYTINVLHSLTYMIMMNKYYKWASLNLKRLLALRVNEFPVQHPIIINLKEMLAECYNNMGKMVENQLIMTDISETSKATKVETLVGSRLSIVTMDNFIEMCNYAKKAVRKRRLANKSLRNSKDYKFLSEQGLTYYNNVMCRRFDFLERVSSNDEEGVGNKDDDYDDSDDSDDGGISSMMKKFTNLF